MPLDAEDREYVISTALDLLRHRKRRRLVQLLGERLARGDYTDPREQDLDRIAHALAEAVDREFGEEGG